MRKAFYNICFSCMCITLLACNSENAFDCIKKTGPVVIDAVPVADFDKISLHDNINLILVSGNDMMVQIEAGKNLLSKISINVTDNILIIENLNTCNWVRDYKAINVYVTNPSLVEVHMHGYGSVISKDTLHTGYLSIISTDSPGDVSLVIEGDALYIVSNHLANFTIAGSLDFLRVGFYFNDSKFYGKNLQVKKIELNHNGINTIMISPSDQLTGIIGNTGNVEIYSDPPVIDLKYLGSGRLIRKD
ncbi:MAG: DUF2807 domain-containing protein [Bacteroidetes bacterium]|nr:DUF2807 domain-containing protein [Bacteroidota bacterium]